MNLIFLNEFYLYLISISIDQESWGVHHHWQTLLHYEFHITDFVRYYEICWDYLFGEPMTCF